MLVYPAASQRSTEARTSVRPGGRGTPEDQPLSVDQLRTLQERVMSAVEGLTSVLSAFRSEPHVARDAQVHLLALSDLRRHHAAEPVPGGPMETVYLEALQAFAQVIEVRDGSTGGHVERVRAYSLAIATTLGLDETVRHHVEMGAVLHDVGKIGIPDAVLKKEAPLTPEEWLQMRTHPEIGVRVLRGVSFLAPCLPAVQAHHERWDGRGYPHGLRGAETPLLGRVVAVADAFDAMTSDRPYRPGLSVMDALSALADNVGSQFDPEIVDAFAAAWDREERNVDR